MKVFSLVVLALFSLKGHAYIDCNLVQKHLFTGEDWAYRLSVSDAAKICENAIGRYKYSTKKEIADEVSQAGKNMCAVFVIKKSSNLPFSVKFWFPCKKLQIGDLVIGNIFEKCSSYANGDLNCKQSFLPLL